MESAFYSLATKSNFNKALNHFFKVNEIVDYLDSKRNLADVINADLDQNEILTDQILPIVGAVIRDKYQYSYDSYNVHDKVTDFAKIAEETVKWTALDILIVYYTPAGEITLVNPKNPAHWERVRELAKDQAMVIYARHLKDEKDSKIEHEAMRRGYAQIRSQQDAPLAVAAGYLVRELATGRKLPPAAANVLELWRPFMEQTAGEDLENLGDILADQAAFARMARKVIADLGYADQLGDDPDEELNDESDAEDAAYATFLTDQNVTCHFNSSWNTRVRRDDLLTIQVDGTKGSAVAGLRKCWTQSDAATPKPVWNPDIDNPIDFRAGWTLVPDNQAYENAFKAQWQLFLRHIVLDEPFPWNLKAGAKGVQLAELGYESWKKRSWMDVPGL